MGGFKIPNYEGVDPTGSWYSVLTPLLFLERAGKYFKDKTAVVYRDSRYTYSTFYDNVMVQASALMR
ncbi:MAG: acyl-CoA synthetase, partial [Metallosphaera sp.]